MEWSVVDETVFICMLHFSLFSLDVSDRYEVAETLTNMAESMSSVRRYHFRMIHLVMKLDELRARPWSFEFFLRQPGIEYVPGINIVRVRDEYANQFGPDFINEGEGWRNFRQRGLPHFAVLREIINHHRLGFLPFDWLYNYASE